MHQVLKTSAGLLWGFAFRDGAGHRVTDETAGEMFAEPHDWSWMHFALSDHRARRFLETFAVLPADARTLLLSTETRPQFHLLPHCAFGILPDIERDFEGQSLGTGFIAFFVDARHLITVRHHPMRVVHEVRQAVIGGLLLATPADAFAHLSERFVAIVEERVRELSGRLDHFEDVVLSDRDDIDQAALGPVRRELSRYHREFLALKGATGRALNAKGASHECPIWMRLGSFLQAVEDFDRDTAALQERARLLYEEMDTRIAAITNRSLRTLTIISTLLLPSTFIVGAFGMNLPSIPWANSPGGFWWAVGLCALVVAGCYGALRRFRIL